MHLIDLLAEQVNVALRAGVQVELFRALDKRVCACEKPVKNGGEAVKNGGEAVSCVGNRQK